MGSAGSQPNDRTEVRLVATVDDFVGCLRVRWAVFVLEQGVPPDEELDKCDAVACHYAALVDGRVVGTVRTFGTPEGAVRIGRLAVLQGYRRCGIATRLMEVALAQGAGVTGFVLDAQLPVIGFYESMGFQARGEVFLDAGIEHRQMVRPAEPSGPS